MGASGHTVVGPISCFLHAEGGHAGKGEHGRGRARQQAEMGQPLARVPCQYNRAQKIREHTLLTAGPFLPLPFSLQSHACPWQHHCVYRLGRALPVLRRGCDATCPPRPWPPLRLVRPLNPYRPRAMQAEKNEPRATHLVVVAGGSATEDA